MKQNHQEVVCRSEYPQMHEPIEENLNKHRLPPQTESDRKATQEN